MYMLTTQQEQLRQELREFVNDRICTGAATLDSNGGFPRELLSEIGKRGYLDASFAFREAKTKYSAIEGMIIIEELSRGLASLGLIISPHYQCKELIEHVGSEALQRDILETAKKGEALLAFAMSEESGGSDALGIDTTAVRDGDRWILNGKKCWITNAGYADGYVVSARSPVAARSRNTSLFYVSKNAPGLRITNSGDMIGLRNSPMGEVIMEDCVIPAHCLIGAENGAYSLIKPLLNEGRLDMAAVALGIAQAALEQTIRRADLPRKYGRRLSSNQAVSFSIAEMYTKILAIRSTLYHVTSEMQEGIPHSMDAAAVKLFATENCREICKAACQIHGAAGLQTNTDVNRLLRDAETLTIAEGASEICKIVISNGILNSFAK